MIRIVPDVGAPVMVAGVDLLTQEYAPDWNEWSSYIMAGGAYIATALGLVKGGGGDFVKNIGIASLPLAARNIVDRIRQPATARRAGAPAARLALRRTTTQVNQPVNRAYQPEFEQAGAHAF